MRTQRLFYMKYGTATNKPGIVLCEGTWMLNNGGGAHPEGLGGEAGPMGAIPPEELVG